MGVRSIVLKLNGGFEVIRKDPDSFETVLKALRSSGNIIIAVLKPPAKFSNNLERIPIVRQFFLAKNFPSSNAFPLPRFLRLCLSPILTSNCINVFEHSVFSSQVEVGEGRFVWALVSRIWEEQATSERVPGIGRC